jgi:hypothetical protein
MMIISIANGRFEDLLILLVALSIINQVGTEIPIYL